MEVKDIIKQLRLNRGWTQEQLGDKMGVQKAAVNKWETGTVELKCMTLKRLSEVFGVSPLVFFDDIAVAVDEDHSWTEDELREINQFKEYIKTKRSIK